MNVGTLDALVGIPVPLRVPFDPPQRPVLARTILGELRLFQGEAQVNAASGVGVLPEGEIDPERIGMVKGKLYMEAGRHGEGGLQFRIVGAAHDPVPVAAFREHAVGGGLPALEGFRRVAQVGFLGVEPDVPHVLPVDGKQAAPRGLQLKALRIQRLQGAVKLVPVGEPDDGKLLRYLQRTGRNQLVQLL